MKRSVSALFPCILLLLVLQAAFRSGSSSAALQETELENRIWQLSVVLRGTEAEGSGCIYGYDTEKQTLVIVTAGHVLTDLQDGAEVLFADGTVLPVTSFLTAEECDLGYAYLACEKLTEEEKQRLEREAAQLFMEDKSGQVAAVTEGLSDEKKTDGKFREAVNVMESSSLQKNDVFHMPDRISTEERSLVTGYVVDPDRYLEEFGCEMVYADGSAVSGMSGSGMFDEEGNLIGILCGVTEQYELAGVPAENIRK